MGDTFNKINRTLKNETTIKNILSSPKSFRISYNETIQDTFLIILRSFKFYINKKVLNNDALLHKQESAIDQISNEEQKMDEEEKENSTLMSHKKYKNKLNSQYNGCTNVSTKNLCLRRDTLAKSSSSNISNSHYLVRQSIRFYAASSVILALCYLTTPISASIKSASHPV